MQSERAETTSTASPTHPALLLVGPTGSGKTPLGEVLAARGLGGRRCLHFDFGAELRRAAADESDLSDKDRTFIRRVLEEGVLLEPGDFPVAARLLEAFVLRHAPGSEDVLVLNGLPRHVDQARALRGHVEIRTVIELRCAPETVRERIRRNAGGDRTGRLDDEAAMVEKKLETYAERTAPLLRYFIKNKVPVTSVRIDARTTPDELLARLERICRWHGSGSGALPTGFRRGAPGEG